MVLTSDNQKINLGLSLKFEAKALKVIGYSRKNDRYWEFSQKAIELIKEFKARHLTFDFCIWSVLTRFTQARYPEVFGALDYAGDGRLIISPFRVIYSLVLPDMARASDLYPGPDADSKVKDARTWLASKGVRDFDPVSLFCDQLDKANTFVAPLQPLTNDSSQNTCSEVQKAADEFMESKAPTAIKKAVVKGIPRQAVLKPAHAIYRLQGQRFALGDRVTMVQDSGGVPLSVKGVVIGLNAKSMDVLWDVPFLSGTTLGGR